MAPLADDDYRALVEHAPTIIWRARPDARRDYFNARWLAFTGRTLAQELGDGWTEGVHPDDRSTYVATYRDHVARREPFELEYRLRRFDGIYRYVIDRGVPYSDAGGTFAGVIGSGVDVDDRHAREVTAGAADFFEMSLDCLCVVGFDGYFVRVNASWMRTLGWTVEELMARPSEALLHPDDREETLHGRRRLHVGSPLGPLVNRYRCKDGTYRWFEWRSVARLDRGLVYAAARDITEQKRAEERLREASELQDKLQQQLLFADRMASVGTLAAGAAHEINNPLAYVAANIAMILEELGTGAGASPPSVAELREMAIEAQEGAERIRKIVRGLKTFSRVEEERRAVIDVRPVLELAIDMTFNEIRHRARLVKDYGETPPIEADDARLGQVFINLLVNAAQALPDDDRDANEIRIVTSTDPEGRAVIEIRDTGPGIPAAIVGRIFDPFFTTKPIGIGTGLGLSICHNLVTAIGGEIGVVTAEGRGTTFRVVLPAAPTGRAEAAIAPPPPAPASPRAAVLVVDDEPAVGMVLRRILRDHDVTVVTTARAAIELLDAGTRFDVILSDLMMPEMSGMELHDQLARRAPDAATRMVFVSGGAFTPIATAFLERVPNPHIEKPFDPQRIRELVQRSVGS